MRARSVDVLGTRPAFRSASPNMRSVSTSENPMMALSGVRSSCDMLARNSDLCWLAALELSALVLDLAEQPGRFWMARVDSRRERLCRRDR